MIRIGSLFSGIGGLDLGLERASPGSRTVWQVEIDPFARRVLDRHWPEARRDFTDVRDFATHLETYASARRIYAVDVICGGFPCQDLSVAGRGAGLDGARSGLFFDYMRIVRALRPRIVVMENVAALLARGLGRVLGELASCGYDAEWDVLSAASVGAPHLRERIFIVAADAQRIGVRHEPDGQPGSEGPPFAPDDGAARDVAYAQGERRRTGRARGADVAGEVRPQRQAEGHAPNADLQHADVAAGQERERLPDAARARAGRPAPDTDGPARGRQGPPVVGHGIEEVCTGASQPRRLGDAPDTDGASGEGVRGTGRVHAQHADADGFRPRPVAWGEPPSSIRRVDDGVPPWMDRPGPRRRKNPDEPGYVASWNRRRRLRPVNDKHRLRALGNAVVPQVAEVVGRRVAEMLGVAP